jgi:hypothetical protein
MYRKGLTVKRIADVCGAVPQTVSRHIRVQRARFPDMVAEHVSNRPPDKPRPPGVGWQANIETLSAFRQAHGRYPTSGDPAPGNRKLAQWLSLQRRANRAGTLPEERRQILAVLPGWESSQRANLDAERWETRLEQLRAFRSAEGRWPRFRNPAGDAERVLGVWLHGQRQAFGDGRLTSAEVRLLDNKVRGWNAWRLKHMAMPAARGERAGDRGA